MNRSLYLIDQLQRQLDYVLRICSAHFEGGEKKEGDIPVPDPQSAERRRAGGVRSSRSTPSESSVSRTSNLKRTRSIALTAHHLVNTKNRLTLDG
uniref:Uncharacterized protein n=1 Tax=Parascaris equorum TaxID=6256 RepID=A0A914RLW9_PAREQ